jgi:hypothetical protein
MNAKTCQQVHVYTPCPLICFRGSVRYHGNSSAWRITPLEFWAHRHVAVHAAVLAVLGVAALQATQELQICL